MIGLLVTRVVPFGVLGAAITAVYFSALGWNIRLYVNDGALGIALLVHLVRLLAIAAAFTVCARQGALALLSSVAGFQMIRAAVVNKQRVAIERNP